MELHDVPARDAGLVLNFTSMDRILHGSTFQYQGTDRMYQPLGSYLLNWFLREDDHSKIACVPCGGIFGKVSRGKVGR